LLDAARGEWIANCDDDDMWVYFPWRELLQAPPDVGLVYGDALLFWEHDCGGHRAGEFVLLRGGEISRGEDIPRAAGSQWIVRRAAWQEVSPRIDRKWEFSDFRLIWHLLRAGWRVLYVPRPFGIVRVHKWAYGGRTWREELARLDGRSS